MSDKQSLEKVFGKEWKVSPISPAFESVNQIATLLNASTYISQGYINSESFFIRQSKCEILRAIIKTSAFKFLTTSDEGNDFEAHINVHDGNLIIISRDNPGNGMAIAIFSNCGLDAIFEFVNKHSGLFVSREDGEVAIEYFFAKRNEGVSRKQLYIKKSKLPVVYPELYPDIDVTKLVKSYLDSEESILMLYGVPGVGKTTFIKFLLSVGNFEQIAYIKDPNIMEMGELWLTLSAGEHDLIIFDDLDSGLTPRKKNAESTFMSQLLSFSDGIFQNNNAKIIITTNQEVTEIDSALVRPGRCFDFVQLHPLTRKQGLEAWTKILNLPEDRFNILFGNSNEITQAALMREAKNKEQEARGYIKSGDKVYSIAEKLERLSIKVSRNNDKTGFGV